MHPHQSLSRSAALFVVFAALFATIAYAQPVKMLKQFDIRGAAAKRGGGYGPSKTYGYSAWNTEHGYTPTSEATQHTQHQSSSYMPTSTQGYGEGGYSGGAYEGGYDGAAYGARGGSGAQSSNYDTPSGGGYEAMHGSNQGYGGRS